MRIVSWNCQGSFRKKFESVLKFDADFYIIQECENPDKNTDKFSKEKKIEYESYHIFSREKCNTFWIPGRNDNEDKGIGIFVPVTKNIEITPLNWENYGLGFFQPVRINNELNLIHVWPRRPGYIEELYVYLQIHKNKFDMNTILMGDFNSNAKGNHKHAERTYTAVARQLSEIGLESAYHHLTGEEPGNETKSTILITKDTTKSRYIDYCFVNPERLINFEVLDISAWIKKGDKATSDHVPIIVDLK